MHEKAKICKKNYKDLLKNMRNRKIKIKRNKLS